VLERAIADDKPCLIEVMIERGSEASPWDLLVFDRRASAGRK
jgi:hypothetical protein